MCFVVWTITYVSESVYMNGCVNSLGTPWVLGMSSSLIL